MKDLTKEKSICSILLKIRNHILSISFLVLVIITSNAQELPIMLQGIVKHDSTYLRDIHVINKTTYLGTSSKNNGTFNMRAALGDSIIFSSIVYQNRIIKITDTHINSKSITVYLEPEITELEVIELEQKIRADWSNVTVPRGTVLDNDEMTFKKPPNMLNSTDPTRGGPSIDLIGLGVMLYKLIWRKKIEKEKETKRINKLKKEFPDKIITIYGEAFFIEELKIDLYKIYQFIDYCQDRGLGDYYASNEFVVKNFLIIQSKKFNAIK